MKYDPYIDDFDGVPDKELHRRLSMRNPNESRYWKLLIELQRRQESRNDIFEDILQ